MARGRARGRRRRKGTRCGRDALEVRGRGARGRGRGAEGALLRSSGDRTKACSGLILKREMAMAVLLAVLGSTSVTTSAFLFSFGAAALGPPSSMHSPEPPPPFFATTAVKRRSSSCRDHGRSRESTGGRGGGVGERSANGARGRGGGVGGVQIEGDRGRSRACSSRMTPSSPTSFSHSVPLILVSAILIQCSCRIGTPGLFDVFLG